MRKPIRTVPLRVRIMSARLMMVTSRPKVSMAGIGNGQIPRQAKFMKIRTQETCLSATARERIRLLSNRENVPRLPLVRRRRAYIFTQPKNRADLMEYVRPLLKKDFVETMALWPIVRWTVPRLGIAYAWAFPFLPMCRHFQRLAYQSGSFLQSSFHRGPSTLSPTGLNLLNVPASGRKETHTSLIYFWERRFKEPSLINSHGAIPVGLLPSLEAGFLTKGAI